MDETPQQNPESAPPTRGRNVNGHGPGFWARRLTNIYSVGAQGIARAGSWWWKRSERWSEEGIEERWAEHLPADPPKNPIWIHAASMGEVRVGGYFAETLIERGYPIIVSAMTETGFQLCREVYPEGTTRFRVPFDLPQPMRKAFAHFNPSALVLIETEWWPNFLTEAAENQVPVFIVNGRLSERAFKRYRVGAAYWRSILRAVRFFFMRTEEEAARIRALGIDPWKVRAAGSLKVPSICRTESEWARLLMQLDDAPNPVWLAGCTRPGEEEMILEAFAILRAEFPTLQLWIAPRHPKRFDKVYRLMQQADLDPVRWSEAEPQNHDTAKHPSVLIDQMGILVRLYARAQVAFIGGSLKPFGGHNPLEPALSGAPVVFGPHMDDQRDGAEILIGMDMATEVDDVASLSSAVAVALRAPYDSTARRQRAELLRSRLLGIREQVAEDFFTFLAVLKSGAEHPTVAPEDGVPEP
jgi:3-deoxy-D-manno-octulosonic-acid transferase